MHGNREVAEHQRRTLTSDFGISRVTCSAEAARMTLGDLLQRFIEAPHLWKPGTHSSHKSVIKALRADPVARHSMVRLKPSEVLAAVTRWQTSGESIATVSARWLVLRSALSWAVGEGLLRTNPIAGVRGPPRPEPRKHHTTTEVRRLLQIAERHVGDLRRQAAGGSRHDQQLFDAEQTLLLTRLAADSGARRGELAVLRISDLDDRVLTIERGISHGIIGRTKSSRKRSLTLGKTTAKMIEDHVERWKDQYNKPLVDDWLFASSPSRASHLSADALSHRFHRLGIDADVPHASLHRLRHAVVTHLVDHGRLLKAQSRAGHKHPDTTLRSYSHAQILEDADVANDIDEWLNGDATR